MSNRYSVCRCCLIWFLKSLILSNVMMSISTKTLTETILSDIEDAFRTVMNNSKAMKQVLHTMYDDEANSSTKATNKTSIYFDIPDESHLQDGAHKVLAVDRFELTKPVFPNLTKEFMHRMIDKRRKNHSDRDINYTVQDPLLTDSDQASLSVIPSPENDTRMRDPLDTDSESMAEISKYIYVGRVNNPFGESVKWRMRNQVDVGITDYPSGDRNKRGVKELYSIIKCATGCKPTVYNDYGCYCGFLGAGKPINGIDNCCRLHDICYEAKECHPFLVYFIPYAWKCHFGRPICAKNAFAERRSCAEKLCECDAMLAQCLKKFACPRKRQKCGSHFHKLSFRFN